MELAMGIAIDSSPQYTLPPHLLTTPALSFSLTHQQTVTVAAKNRMELAMGIAIGSSTQIALLVIPSLTLAGWALGQDMTLEFPPIEVSV